MDETSADYQEMEVTYLENSSVEWALGVVVTEISMRLNGWYSGL